MSSWDDAIAYATRRVESLNAAIKVFKKHRDSGEPFIGQSDTDSQKDIAA